MLSDYDDKIVVDFLEFGFPIGFTGKFNNSANKGKNHKGVSEYSLEVRKYLEKEMSYKAVLGPFSEIPFSNECCISPLNTVSKKDSSERRVILDLSFPEGAAVNEGIPKDSYLGTKIDLFFPGLMTWWH